MDVVLTSEGPHGGKWTLKDRLGRNLGSITKLKNASDFQIQPDALGLLKGVKRRHPTLNEAMSAIASLTNGACTLDSRDWD
ncbi:hypothetical protein [Methylobacterium sp. J-068]|uniref:hypothetical protein n=1 Tax=Methylobacterium sp. J-068 TaxID=2836649 RepID=UPI001FBA9FFA|nr:hypothetical protein [Methylobacterium sp. J-068]MCJ2034622.1 hypothetical protein [Methylobacterium sp. J-068]